MRIGIDLTALTSKRTGVDRYLFDLASGLARAQTSHRFVAFINYEDSELFAGPVFRSFRVHRAATRSRITRLTFQQAALPVAAAALALDVVHSPSFIMPLVRGRARHVLSIHDLTTITMPEAHIPLRRSWAFARAMKHSIVSAQAVCVPSDFVREDILRQVPGVDPSKLRVIPHGINPKFQAGAIESAPSVTKRLGIEPPYILYLGNIDPRKNIEVLLRAFGILTSGAAIAEQLVIAGPLGWDFSGVLALAGARTIRPRIHLPGYIPDDDLPALMAGASVFAYPSCEEGFGFPPLEAMACGTPVVASRTSALTENLEGAARLVPVGDADALADALQAVLQDPAERDRLRRAGIKRAARFSWHRTVERTLAAYEGTTDPYQRDAESVTAG